MFCNLFMGVLHWLYKHRVGSNLQVLACLPGMSLLTSGASCTDYLSIMDSEILWDILNSQIDSQVQLALPDLSQAVPDSQFRNFRMSQVF